MTEVDTVRVERCPFAASIPIMSPVQDDMPEGGGVDCRSWLTKLYLSTALRFGWDVLAPIVLVVVSVRPRRRRRSQSKFLNLPHLPRPTHPPSPFPMHGVCSAALPIGAHEPAWFMQDQHCSPEEAVTIHQELGAKRSVAVHWVRGAWVGGESLFPSNIERLMKY